MKNDVEKPEGLREWKRKQTFQRITEVSMGYFLEKGFDATTIDEIAEAAGISRRTFFYYFKSKDEILLAQLEGYADAIKAAALESDPAQRPLDAGRDALRKVIDGFNESAMRATAELMRNSGVLSTRRYASYIRFEQVLYECFCQIWPDEARQNSLRLAAMATIGALRIATERWQQTKDAPLSRHLEDAFTELKAEL